MEEDHPGRHDDRKMPILDIEVWLDEKDGFILYQHYQKPISSKLVMHADSAQSNQCKNSVHTQEILRKKKRKREEEEHLNWQEVGKYLAVMMTKDEITKL